VRIFSKDDMQITDPPALDIDEENNFVAARILVDNVYFSE
jgi:hypothetical protein